MPQLHLMLPLWGQVRVDDFLNIGARMLLAPNNLPAASKLREIVIPIYTTKSDWRYMEHHDTVMRLRKFARLRPVFFELDESVSKHIIMSRGHRVMLEAAAIAGALASPIFADSVFADGDIVKLIKLATGAPVRMVMMMGFRISYEPFVERFPAVDPKTGAAVLSNRELVALAMRHQHSQMRCWSADNPGYGDDILGGPIWNVGDHGCVSHSIYWEPGVIDFSHEWEHDSTPIDDWTIDGHYPWVNTAGPETYAAIADSDDFFHVTLAHETGPLAYHFEHRPMRGSLVEEMRRARAHRTTDPLRQELYETRFRVHARDIRPTEWARAEAAAQAAVIASRVPKRELYALTELAPPRRVETAGQSDIWHYEGLYYPVPLSLGPVDLQNGDIRRRYQLVGYGSEADAYQAAMKAATALQPSPAGAPITLGQPAPRDRSWSSMLPPVLLGEVHSTNIVRVGGSFYTVPQHLGPLDLERHDHRTRPGIGEFRSEAEARIALANGSAR